MAGTNNLIGMFYLFCTSAVQLPRSTLASSNDRKCFRFLCDQPILMISAIQRSGTSTMAPRKTMEGKTALKGAIPAPSAWLFVRAAIVANLMVATLVFSEFSVMSLVNRDFKDFQMGFWLVPFVTLVVWSSATLFYVMTSTLGWLHTLRRWLIARSARSLPSNKSGVWDDWLDSPEPHTP
jgi:hypothetical protein